eukprot:NODE_3101_length_597_cov_337.452555_g2596_i0.p1 GENE.NODE_3101_length_597_cov_337.452555_g2596_i0~~NODE_3101_length_597_cov_337.452555_g2596_i0.p1  ORF type:complete len:142 (-),score=59.04 NODE_3101_length_597_cov_337.452555_g2596_i0:172-534(-)
MSNFAAAAAPKGPMIPTAIYKNCTTNLATGVLKCPTFKGYYIKGKDRSCHSDAMPQSGTAPALADCFKKCKATKGCEFFNYHANKYCQLHQTCDWQRQKKGATENGTVARLAHQSCAEVH